MAANNAAADLGPPIPAASGESTSDVVMGQMVFEISSREQSPELLMPLSREDRELLGEVVD